MASGMRRLALALVVACASAFAPPRAVSKARAGVVVQFEQATLIGVGTALSGLVFGVFIASFSEKQIVHTRARNEIQ
jgi:predicted benzoate:H+ symporter BenE